MNPTVPHLRIVVAACVAAVIGYLGFSIWVVLWSNDVALKGDVIGTWTVSYTHLTLPTILLV